MVTTPIKVEKRLTIQVQEIAENTTTIRSLDWDRDRFDIEFGLQNGTTYNSYIIRGEKLALVETSHEKFRQLYLDTLKGLINPHDIDYIIVNHTEPDHSGLVKDVLNFAPHATVVGSKVALKFLEDFIHDPFKQQIVKTGDQIDLGKGHVLNFANAPNLHWPDTMLTYDGKTGLLYSCDVFGMHYCSNAIWDEDLKAIEPDYRFYYDCLMGPNARSVLAALKRMEAFGAINQVCNGHGPILKYNVTELIERYNRWSKAQTKAEELVSVFYISDYGYSDRLSQAIARGITKTEVGVEMVDLKTADPQEVQEIIGRSSAIVMGLPPISGNNNKEITTNIGTILAAAKNQQIIGFFESYGGNDEPIDPLLTKFREIGLDSAFPPIRIKNTPTENTYQICEESGTDLGQKLTQTQKVQKRKSLDSDLDKAIGRISGGLYIITAKKGAVASAMLASWVTQASFDPPGITISVAKDRAIESLMQVGDTFVLNILEEGKYQSLMKHFLKRFPPGADRFAGVNTQRGENGSPILTEALAYLECEVMSRMECSDHWVVYSKIVNGRVSDLDGLTAVHHRKVGNYY